MKKNARLYQNIPLGLSAGAYFILAVPATGEGLTVGILLAAICLLLGLFLPNAWKFVRENASKGYWIAAGAVCLLMGLRFDNVWKLSSQISALTALLGLDNGIFLSVVAAWQQERFFSSLPH